MSMILDIKKELKYGFRNSRFLILAAGFLFFALSTPMMMKVLLPELLKSQYPNIAPDMLNSLLDITQKGTMQSYMGDVFEVGTIIVVFTLCGIMAQELKDNTLVLPICSGKSYGGITLAKMLVFGIALIIILTVSLILDYVYAGMLMGYDFWVWLVVKGGLLQGLYMVFLLSCLVMFGTIIKKPVAAGVLTLIFAYGSHYIGGALGIAQFMPSGLLADAQTLSIYPSETLWLALIITTCIILLFCWIAVMRLKKMELNGR